MNKFQKIGLLISSVFLGLIPFLSGYLHTLHTVVNGHENVDNLFNFGYALWYWTATIMLTICFIIFIYYTFLVLTRNNKERKYENRKVTKILLNKYQKPLVTNTNRNWNQYYTKKKKELRL